MALLPIACKVVIAHPCGGLRVIYDRQGAGVMGPFVRLRADILCASGLLHPPGLRGPKRQKFELLGSRSLARGRLVMLACAGPILF